LDKAHIQQTQKGSARKMERMPPPIGKLYSHNFLTNGPNRTLAVKWTESDTRSAPWFSSFHLQVAWSSVFWICSRVGLNNFFEISFV